MLDRVLVPFSLSLIHFRGPAVLIVRWSRTPSRGCVRGHQASKSAFTYDGTRSAALYPPARRSSSRAATLTCQDGGVEEACRNAAAGGWLVRRCRRRDHLRVELVPCVRPLCPLPTDSFVMAAGSLPQ
ncbi:hypothetical protein BD414DRAFT_232533 [Trametes punicea]|nr:hypothetical protein BD414DRAFT_232533 [Trametes punicea]